MRILQQHVDFIEYEPIRKEIAQAEEYEGKRVRIDEAVVLFTSVESADDEEIAKRAINGTKEFLQKLHVNKVLIYPYAHLSQDLAEPASALEILKMMERYGKEIGIEVYRSPFGWNKALQIKVKGHPLAEQSRTYSLERYSIKESGIERRKRELSEHEMLARIKKSDFTGLPETDHRVIGERLDLFSFQEPSPGMVYWHDKGVKLRNILTEFIRSELAKRKYIEIGTPALANTILWKISGHWEYYKDNMFITELGEEEFGLKPMNCPSTFLFYKTRRWSYRDLPLRVADFDQLYRNELSGVASGLFRVKILTQDDAHIFVAEDQIESEIDEQIEFMKKMYGIFKLDYKVRISTLPDKYIGAKEQWEEATRILIDVIKRNGIKPELSDKEGAFYGPKIDIDIKDSLGRHWQCSTIQLDFQMPKRFKLTYSGTDGKEHTPVVIHRVIYGSLERFIGIIIEHFQGRFPLWLSPVQVRVIPISDQHVKYAEAIVQELNKNKMRVDDDFDSGTLDSKIKKAQLQKIPYMVVIGQKEYENNTIAVRTREGKVQYGTKFEDFLKELEARIKTFS
jgi:threonyl-tRNA synthetase